MQRPLNSSAPKGEGMARTGAPKNISPAPISLGMKRQTAPSHEFLHGAPLNDEPLEKSYTTAAPIHPAMKSDKLRGEHVPGRGNETLTEAANLGRKA